MVAWAYITPPQRRPHQSRGNITYQIDPLSGKILFRGFELDPYTQLKKADLEQALQGLLEKIGEMGDSLTLEAIAIEDYVATTLWNEGTLRLEHLETAEHSPACIKVQLELLGQPQQVQIFSGIYWEHYEFRVSRLPGEILRVRDVPAGQAMLHGEYIL